MIPLTHVAIATGLMATIAGAALASDTRTVQVHFPHGATGTTITDKITGYESVSYVLGAREGQFLTVSMRPDNQSADFNIYIPGKGPGDDALFSSEAGDREYEGQLYVSGDHTVSVFLNRNAARQGQTANYDITFEIE